jgi:hypothetical protein
VAASYDVPVVVTPAQGSRYRLGDGEWKPVPSAHFSVAITGDATLHVENKQCQPMDLDLKPGQTEAVFDLRYLPATVIAQCDPPRTVEIDGRPMRTGEKYPVPFGDTTLSTKMVTVDFLGTHNDIQKVTVHPAETLEVKCVSP